jgi:hypothetical protein
MADRKFHEPTLNSECEAVEFTGDMPFPHYALANAERMVFRIEHNGEQAPPVFPTLALARAYRQQVEHPECWTVYYQTETEMIELSDQSGFVWYWDGKEYRGIEL